MSSRTFRIVSTASTAAYVVAGAAAVGLVTLGLFFWIGAPWGTINDIAGVVTAAAVAPTMLAFYELGGLTPTRLAQLAQASGWLAVIVWCAVHLLFIAGVVTFDYDAPATGAMALEQAALVVIGLWIAGANLLAGAWLSWIRWLGVVAGIGLALVGAGLVLGGMSHPLNYAGSIGYLIALPVWAFLLARLLRRIAATG